MRENLIQLFLKKNSELNLSAIRDYEGVQYKHINDSLEVTKLGIIKPGMTVCDVGTGSGFPLLPLAISYPETLFTGIDSVRKKTIAVNDIIQDLKIKNAKVVWTRIEDYRGVLFDVITARAVAYSDKLLNRTYPILKKNGYFVFFKQKTEEERSLLLSLCKKYHLHLVEEHDYQLFPEDIKRTIYVLKKD